MTGIFSKLRQTFLSKKGGDRYLSGLDKSKKSFSEHIWRLALDFTGVDEEFLEDLMVVLLEMDIGIKTVQKIADEVENHVIGQKLKGFDETSERLIKVMHKLYTSVEDEDLHKDEDGPTVISMVGINDNGKTTTTAKLTKLLQSEDSGATLAAADTFRIGAVDQLVEWADRLGTTCIKGREGGDPSAILVNACRYAKEYGTDYLIGDAARRLQNKTNLMQELNKMHGAIEQEIPGAPHEMWLVLDVTTGQNGTPQAQILLETTKVSGIILTKIDGMAKGGIVIVIRDLLGLPVKYIGLDEKEGDLHPFDIDSYLYDLCEDTLQHG